MSTIFWKKSFPLCFSISKCRPTTQSPPPPLSDDQDHTQTTSSSSSSSLALKNYNFVYDIFAASSSNSDDFFSSASDDFRDIPEIPSSAPDFAAVFASRRFFFSSPGMSNSIIESTPDHNHHNHQAKPPPPIAGKGITPAAKRAGGVEVPKYSVDPYVDFRRSMQEMMEARDVNVDGRTDLEYLHELLLCFLALNPKDTHKFIISAFTDIVVTLLSTPDNGRRHREIKLRRRRNGVRRLSM
ncbi:Ovate protein family, C-terminal [Parasponia andersonii]|uniref:Transcription repressor n=1 Tax=Parasponia andersonii TaxID=3476 RepID=A0A2P5E3E9_PARAD|nr:Ovate protein family, C-terminal [Parasponia andersonii]